MKTDSISHLPSFPFLLRDYGRIFLITLIWAINFSIIEVSLKEIPPLMLSALRFLFCAFPTVFFIATPSVKLKKMIIIGLVFGVLFFGSLILSMSLGASAGVSAVILQSQFIYTLVFSYFIDKINLSKPVLWGILFSIIGLTILYYGTELSSTPISFFLLVVSALFFGYSNILFKSISAEQLFSVIVYSCLLPPIPLFILSMIFEGQSQIISTLLNLDITQILAILYLLLLSTIFAFYQWRQLIQKYHAVRIAHFSLLVPVFALIVAHLFLGEEINFSKYWGSFFMIVGLLIIILTKRT